MNKLSSLTVWIEYLGRILRDAFLNFPYQNGKQSRKLLSSIKRAQDIQDAEITNLIGFASKNNILDKIQVFKTNLDF